MLSASPLKSVVRGTVGALLACAALCVSAAELPKIVVDETVEVAASPTAVWKKVRNFGDLHSWVPGIPNTEIVRGRDHHPGAIRLVILGEKAEVTEDLVAFSDADRSMTYRIIQAGPLPLASYQSTLTVMPATEGRSTIRWTGTFTRRSLAANPPAGETDADAEKLIRGAYRAGIDNVRAMFEAK